MTPEERDRLTRLEVQMSEVKITVDDIDKNVREMNLKFAKAGGVMVALAALGAVFGWFVTQISGIKGWFA